MQYFSHDYYNQLVNEHKLIAASIAKLQDAPQYYMRQNNTAMAIEAALQNMLARKVELEIKIDVLGEFLN
jgi:hypothetical protein